MNNTDVLAAAVSLIALFAVALAGGCENLERGDAVPVGRTTDTMDGQWVGTGLPPDATNAVYIGNNWVEFDRGPHRYLMRDKYRHSAITVIGPSQTKAEAQP